MMAYMNACGVAMSYQIDFGIDYIIPSVVNNNFIHCSSRDNKMNIVYPTYPLYNSVGVRLEYRYTQNDHHLDI
jgi:hypothetical protein